MPMHDAAEHTGGGVDSRELLSLIVELNIARRNSRSYPAGHQVVEASLHKVLATYAGLRGTGDHVAIGVACDTLLLGGTALDKSNLVYRDFAKVLYDRGIGVLILHRGLTLKELERFIAILGTKRDEIFAAGGIQRVWEESGITSIEIRAIRYDLFTASEVGPETDGEGRGLWQRYAHGLVHGLLGSEGGAESQFDPEVLAEMLNQEFDLLDGDAEGDPLAGLGELTGQLAGSELLRSEERRPSRQSDLAYRKLALFVDKLSPGLRRQFLNSTFDVKRIGNGELASGLIGRLSADTIIDTLRDVSEQQISVPPFVLALLERSGDHGAESARAAVGLSDQELQEKMRSILKEHAMEEFVPQSYQNKLDLMMAADTVPFIGLEGVDNLALTMEPAHLESKTGDILLLLLREGEATEEGRAALARSLNEICTFFLQTGSYQEVLRILEEVGSERLPEQARQELLQQFLCRATLDEVLDGLEVWGKGKFDEIAELIRRVGLPFTEALLDRLAQADSMSLRRFLMDRLVELGPGAGPATAARLSDRRWYFLRNLITVLRQLEYADAVEGIRPLVRHTDPRVAHEALRALVQFRDPEAEARLLRDLEHPDREVQLNCLRTAGKCASPRLIEKLHSLLTGAGFSSREVELKILVVQALGEIGTPNSLPPLAEVLASRSLLHPVLLARLKQEVVAALARFPQAASRPILARLVQGGGSLGEQAAQTLAAWRGRSV